MLQLTLSYIYPSFSFVFVALKPYLRGFPDHEDTTIQVWEWGTTLDRSVMFPASRSSNQTENSDVHGCRFQQCSKHYAKEHCQSLLSGCNETVAEPQELSGFKEE
jgi:hypothetical protein